MAVKLQHSKHLGRKIRWDDWDAIGIPTWTLAEEAIRDGRIEEGLELFYNARFGLNFVRYEFVKLFVAGLNYLVDKQGEQEVEKFWRALGKNLPLRRELTPEMVLESVKVDAEVQRSHLCGPSGLGDLTVVEEKDRYVVTADPCGTGGRARKDRLANVTKKAYPWSWGKAGVPYHCCHCSVWWEMMAIEDRGFPLKIHENVDNLDGPCIHLYYKSPELIPDKYFERLGKKKDPSKFKK